MSGIDLKQLADAENACWQDGQLDFSRLTHLQKLFHRYEKQRLESSQPRRSITVVIPVADRPAHLRTCLDSLLEQCQSYQYGGLIDGFYAAVSVIIADDSLHQQSRQAIESMLDEYRSKGLLIEYLGLQQQSLLLATLSVEQFAALNHVIGDQTNLSGHKGASITRNICYLRLRQLADLDKNRLFMFIDSDQEFRVNLAGHHESVQAINYFHHLEQIFADDNVEVLTGKVVGDPPVSPAVMGANFLDDVIAQLLAIENLSADQSCIFHGDVDEVKSDAAYHDMADLFGFKAKLNSYRYPCPLQGEHALKDSLQLFASRLNNFFYGEHPTRVSYFHYRPMADSISPARTVYTGNYVLKPSALRYFIPFAPLKLRMAGPVLGRIIQSEIGHGFVSANLPLLHKRTWQDSGASECRPGVIDDDQSIDLSGEFIRQFYGDVMLFSTVELTSLGFPEKPLSVEQIAGIVSEQREIMFMRYQQRQQTIVERLEHLQSWLDSHAFWWQALPEITEPLTRFLRNMRLNFSADSSVFRQLNDADTDHEYCQQIITALSGYPVDKSSWHSLTQV